MILGNSMFTGAEPQGVCRMVMGSGRIEMVKFDWGQNVKETFNHIFEQGNDMTMDVFRKAVPTVGRWVEQRKQMLDAKANMKAGAGVLAGCE